MIIKRFFLALVLIGTLTLIVCSLVLIGKTSKSLRNSNIFEALETNRDAVLHPVEKEICFLTIQNSSHYLAKLINSEEVADSPSSQHLNNFIMTNYLNLNYSTNTICKATLSVAYFGNGEYGLDTAVNTIYSQTISEVSFSEAQTLATIMQTPSLRKNIKVIDAK